MERMIEVRRLPDEAQETSPFPIFSESELASAVFLRRGTIPVCITVPHDGTLTSIGNRALSPDPHSKRRDMKVESLAQSACHQTLRSLSPFYQIPTLAVDKIYRACRTPQIENHFAQRVEETVQDMADHARKANTSLLFLDLHGFINQPHFGEYDLILGTGNKQTVRDSTVDEEFAVFMQDRGYRVYVPSRVPRKGEKFGATHPSTLVQRVYQLSLPNVLGMQIEIAQHLRRNVASRTIIGKDMGDFIADWVRRNDAHN